ncbi:MAG: Maf family protein [Victivallaceae bacterium]|nr:Maf family protein [Victivallaceae bacterium]
MKNNPLRLILASRSERRSRLLTEMGLDFIRVPAAVEELDGAIYCSRAATLNAVRKAGEVAARYPDALVIGADTVIEYRDKIIGKPADPADAERILLELSGAVHTVVSGVSLQAVNRKIRCTFAVCTEVRFKPFTVSVIREYLSRVQVLDKAGAYAIQEHGEMLIEAIEGPLDNVVGLPCRALQQALDAIFRLEQPES